MTTPRSELLLTLVVHEDAHVSIVKQKEGWGDAYQKKAAVLHLSKADLQKLGLKGNARVELTSAAGSVVVTATSDATCEAGIGFMPSGLYANRLSGYDPGSPASPGRHLEVRVASTERDVTPVTDLKVRGDRA